MAHPQVRQGKHVGEEQARGGQVLSAPGGTWVPGASRGVRRQTQKEFPAIISRMLRIPDVPGVGDMPEARCSSPPLWDAGSLAT